MDSLQIDTPDCFLGKIEFDLGHECKFEMSCETFKLEGGEGIVGKDRI